MTDSSSRRPFRDGLLKFLEWAVIAIMGALVLTVLWQVATRAAHQLVGWLLAQELLPSAGWTEAVQPSGWTDELARMLLIWGSLLGGALGFARKAHLGVDYLVGKFDPASRCVAEMFAHALTAFFAAAVMVYGGTTIVVRTLATEQVSAALGIAMGYVYLVLPISGAFIVLFSLEMLAERAAALRRGRVEEETTVDRDDSGDRGPTPPDQEDPLG